jgi:hypothetical protein
VKVRYVGPHDEVEVPALGIACARGATVEVDDDQARSLLVSEVWEAAEKAAKGGKA